MQSRLESAFMKTTVIRQVAWICFLVGCVSFGIAFNQPSAYAQTPTLRVQSSLVLVDVISQDPKSGLPVRDFKREDFRVFDNRHEVRISTFDAGAQYDTRPITLWLVAICNEAGYQSLGRRQNLRERNHTFGPHLITWRTTTPWELLIGAITVRPSSICRPPKTAIALSEHWPKRSRP